MALYKEYTSPQGIVSKYHRITGVSKRGNCLSVTLSSYMSQEYRKKEGDELTIDTDLFKTLRDRVTELSVKDRTDEEEQEYKEKRKQYYDMGLKAMNSSGPMAVQNTLIIVPLDGDEISYKLIYQELKKTEEMYGAEDC